jgi:hypothetical protein
VPWPITSFDQGCPSASPISILKSIPVNCLWLVATPLSIRAILIPAPRHWFGIWSNRIAVPPQSNPSGGDKGFRVKVVTASGSAFMIHTGDISHLSPESQFDDADRIISQARLDVHYVPGEHDFLDPDWKFYVDRYGRGTKGAGWYSFDANGVHFIAAASAVSNPPVIRQSPFT